MHGCSFEVLQPDGGVTMSCEERCLAGRQVRAAVVLLHRSRDKTLAVYCAGRYPGMLPELEVKVLMDLEMALLVRIMKVFGIVCR